MRTFLRLMRFLRAFPGWAALSVLLSVATITAGIGLLGTSAYLIAAAALQPSIAALQVAIVGVRFWGFSRGFFRYLERLFSHSVNLQLVSQIRVWFYRSLEPLAPAGLQSYRWGDVLARANADIEQLESFFVRVVSPILAALLVTVGISVWVGQSHWGLALILITGLALSGVLLPFFGIRASRRPAAVTAATRAELSAVLVDGLQGIAELVAYRQESAFLDRVDRLTRDTHRAQTRQAWIGTVINGANQFFASLTMWAVVLLGGWLVTQNQLDGVSLAVLALVALASFEAVQPLGWVAQQLESSLQAGRRLFALVDQEPRVKDPEKPGRPPQDGAISIRGLNFRYTPELPLVFKDVQLEIPNGQRVALTGASGVGKTTLFNLLLKFWQPEAGDIRLGGTNLEQLTGETARRTISLMAQDTYLFDATLRHNLLLAQPGAREAALWQALSLAQLEDWARSLPKGLDTWVGEHGQKLSGGERQRLAIARLFLQDSRIVLLDEPTSHLDPVTAQQVNDSLFNVTRGKTVIWVTHETDSLAQFDRVIRLEGGRLV